MQGTIHLKQPRLGPVCKALGVDYAPAMLGFEIRAGRSVPVIQGVVVCEQHQEAVLLAWEAAERCLPLVTTHALGLARMPPGLPPLTDGCEPSSLCRAREPGREGVPAAPGGCPAGLAGR